MVRGKVIMKKILVILIISLFIVPVIGQTRPPEDASVEEFNKYYQEREAKAEEEAQKLENKIEELETQISEITAQAENIREWKPEEKELLNKYEEVKKQYVVKKGDWLSKLAEYEEIYGKGNYWKWPVIYRANRDKIDNVDLIYPGQEFKIPRLLPKKWEVYKGETLTKISSYYEIYDSAEKWKKIYEANKEKISNPDVVDSGTMLQIPRP
ncbi:MAG: LysM peptidoglycan-binding domain-containing protein [Candidatus Mcinerneyibacterium aminivorans]|uniref:LysM peptidoglycan-binding domain-containing protein n=1 Tax=Candidatus Mcinerneyibacterium aminivorans TaxID=2703815 RepID=A0A5D0MJN5_9BACT|nr:MAG: LysM peptidoglycan-binding domain-containing protein [Candidatus Mcinerneyibacterium aminivorans]